MAHVLAKDLREAVLQAAITGGLSEHLYTDSSVKELLDSIAIEKTNLFKGKKDKYLTPINTDEYPFDIPEEWSFAKLGYISTYATSKNKINAKNANPDLWMLDLEDIEKGGRVLNKKRVSDSKAIGDKTYFDSGDILYSKLRPYLQKILIVDEKGVCTPELIPFKLYGEINPNYILLFLKSPYVDTEINKVTYGVKMPRVGTETMVNLYVPIPPIEEQARIVAKVDEIMAKIDEYEKLENELVELKKNFPGDMKAAVLQAAMQGKLTGNNWNEDDNPEIYVPLWSVTAWDKKFKAVDRQKQKKILNYHYYLAAEMKAIEDNSGDVYLLSTGDYEGWTTDEKTKGNSSFGEIVSIPWGGNPKVKYYKGKFITSDNRIATALNREELDNKFLYYFMQSKVDYLDTIYRGTGLRHPDMSAVLDMQIPLPPIEEQKRIVDKLDELLPLVDKLAELN